MTNFNERLKKLRREKDLTQENLAEYMGVSPQAVSRWETGAACPDITALPMLASLFGISVDALLGVDEETKLREIGEIVKAAEEKIDRGITEEPIRNLRKGLQKYPNNDQLLCCLMYGLYVASEDELRCREYDGEILAIAKRIAQYSTNDRCRNESRRLLFRHCCDTGRKEEALAIAEAMADMETCRELNLYWALDGAARLSHLKELMAYHQKMLLWDISAYETHGVTKEEEKETFRRAREEIKAAVTRLNLFE